MQDAMLSANAFDSQLEIDLDMIRADEHTDSGWVWGEQARPNCLSLFCAPASRSFNEVASRMRGMVMRRQPSLAGSADVANSAP